MYQDCRKKYGEDISKDVDDVYIDKYTAMIGNLQKFISFLDNSIGAEMDKPSVSIMEAIRKSSYCLALERCKNSIYNILEGKPFDFVES